MRFGTTLPLVQRMPGQPDWEKSADPAALVAVAHHADELGYEWLPCSDHVVVPQKALEFVGATWYEPATTLAFVAGMTSSIRLLTHVLVLPYHSPFDIAKQYGTLDRLSGGRVILGVGTGHLRPEFLALGVDYESRGDVTDEYVRIIKALWLDQPASFRGERYQFHDLHLAPRPVQQPHPPVWIGGNTRRAVRRAVELGDGWVPWQVTFDELRDRLDYARGLPSYAERARPLDVTVPAGPVEFTANAIDGERAPFTGSVAQIVEDVRAYESIGVTGMTAGFRSRSLAERLEQLDQFARDVMPAFA